MTPAAPDSGPPSSTAADPLAGISELAVQALRVERKSTASRVSETLRDSIIRGDLPPGTPLREQVLSATLEVSRNTVREALRLLDHEGLVDYHVHRGVTVRRLSQTDVQDLYRAREAIEIAAIEAGAAAHRSALEGLAAVVANAEEAAGRGDWRTVATLDIVFHQRIVELVGSERLDTFFQRIVAELRLGFAAMEPTQHGPFVAWNRTLVDLLLAGDVERCAAEMREYLASSEQMLQQALGNLAP